MSLTIAHAQQQIQAMVPQATIRVERFGDRFEALAIGAHTNESLGLDGVLESLVEQVMERRTSLTKRLDEIEASVVFLPEMFASCPK